MIRLGLAAAAAAALLAGCGGGGGHGRATLWVTRDQGRTVLLVRSVPAGETAIQALERSAEDLDALRRAVRAGDRRGRRLDRDAARLVLLRERRSRGTRGAAEYRLHAGDVEWWDYRDWGRVGESVPVVVGAFPEPFLHGYAGRRGRRSSSARAAVAAALARLCTGRSRPARRGARTSCGSSRAAATFTARLRPGGGVELDFSGDAARLARDPQRYRYRYPVP